MSIRDLMIAAGCLLLGFLVGHCGQHRVNFTVYQCEENLQPERSAESIGFYHRF